jgi:TP901 family phage tail tape measure protein
MGPAAILSILVSTNTTEASTKLSKFDKQLAATDKVAKKGIEARLGATFNSEAFKRYETSLERAARIAKDREAFKAQLGANFNNRAFRQYQRAIDQSVASTKVARVETDRLSTSFTGLGRSAFGAAAGLAGVGVGVAAIGYEAVRSGMKFQQAMEMIHTQASAPQAEVQKMSKAVLGLGLSTEQGPVKLAHALYELESVGLRGATALKSLHASSDLAAIGMADLNTATSAVASAMVAWHLKASQAGQTAATLNAIVGAGKMHMQDLVEAMGTKLPGVADMLGVSLHSVGGALAVFTDAGESAQMAATNLVTPLFKMAVVTAPKAKEALASIGLGVHALANDFRTGGINKAIDDLHNRLEATFGNSQAGLNAQTTMVATAFGGSKGSAPIMQLLTQVDRLKQRYDLVGKGISTWAEKVAAEHATAAHKVAVALSMIKTGFVELGLKALPVVASVLGAVENFVTQIQKGKGAGGEFASAFSTAFNAVKSVVVTVSKLFGGMGNMIKGVAVAFGILGAAVAATTIIEAVNPMFLLFTAVAAAAALIIDHWKTVGPFLAGVWNSVKSVAGPVIQWLVNAWDNATHAISNVARAVFPTVEKIVTVAFTAIKVAVTVLKGVFMVAWDILAGIVKTQVAIVVFAVTKILVPAFNFVKGPLEWLGGLFLTVFNQIRKIVGTVIDFVLGALSTFLHGAGGVFSVLSNIPLLGGAFDGLGKAATSAGDTIDTLRRQLNGIPPKVIANVGVNVNFASNLGSVLDGIVKGLGGKGPVGSLTMKPPAGLKGAPHSASRSAAHRQATRALAPSETAAQRLAIAKQALGTAPASRVTSSAAAAARATISQASTSSRAVAAAQAQVTKLEGQIAKDRAQLAATPSTALKTSLRADILARETELKAARARESAAKKLATAQQRAAAKAQAILDKAAGVTHGVQVPSQAVGAQIKMAQLANQLQVAQNAANIPGQQTALNAEVKLEKLLISADQKRLMQVNNTLKNSHLSSVKRAQALQNRLTLLQEIGNMESSLGSAMSSLTSLTGTGTSASTSQFDLTPGGAAVNLPTAFDVARALGGRSGLAAARHGAEQHRPLHGAPVGPSHVVNVNPTFHITAAVNANDTKAIVDKAVDKMTDDIERGVKGHLRAQRRSAGLRGS